MKIQVIDVTSSKKKDDFNDLLEDIVNKWEDENEGLFRIKDVSVFGFEVLYHTNISHAKVMIKYV